MPIDPVSAGLGAVSLVSGKGAQKKAAKQASQAQAGQKAIEQRMIQLYDTLFNRAKQAEQSGEFDPEKRIAALESDTARYEARDAGNLAGAMRVAGYKPGDSEIGTRQDAVKIKYRSFLDNMRNEIRTRSWQDQQNAYASAGGANLSAPLASMGNRASAPTPNPAGFLANLLPSFTQKPKQGGFNINQYQYPAMQTAM